MSKFLQIFRRSASPTHVTEQHAQDEPLTPSEEKDAHSSPEAPSGPTLFIGHTRFSVHQHGSGYFNATRGADRGAGLSEQEYTEWLYSDTRLAPRTEIFTTLSLPQLEIAARKHDVVHFVSYSPSLPEHHKEKLRAAATKFSFLRLNETTNPVNSTPSRTLVRQALAERDHGNRPFGVYRLDDDDLLSVRYFDQMATYVTPRHVGWWVSLGTGFSALRMNGKYVYTRELYYPKSAFGPMAIAAQDSTGEIANLAAPKHTVMDKFNPTILDSREPAYFHIRHESQDSTVKGSVAPFYPEAMNRILGEGPADLAQVCDLFPVIAGDLSLEPGPAGTGVSLISDPLTLDRDPVTFEWPHAGPVALLVQTADEEKLRANQLQVRVAVSPATDSTAEPAAAGIKGFLSQGKFRYSEQDDSYRSHMPQKSSGFGFVLPIEPPSGVRITRITLINTKSEPLNLSTVSAYPLPLRQF